MKERKDIHLPDLGEVEEVTVVGWLKRVGDLVSEGEDLLEVETEKTTFVVPAPASGRIERIAVGKGDKVRIGGLLGEIAID